MGNQLYDLDVQIQKYVAGKLNDNEKLEMLNFMVRFYNDLLIWVHQKRKVQLENHIQRHQK